MLKSDMYIILWILNRKSQVIVLGNHIVMIFSSEHHTILFNKNKITLCDEPTKIFNIAFILAANNEYDEFSMFG